MENLETGGRQLEKIVKDLRKEEVSKQARYETDEEELKRETGWSVNRITSRKKRKANSSPESFPLQTETIDKNNNDKKSMPPPIFVNDVKNFNMLKETLLQGANNDINFKTMANNEIKISTTDSDDFRATIHLLRNAKSQENHNVHNIDYHTYVNNQNLIKS